MWIVYFQIAMVAFGIAAGWAGRSKLKRSAMTDEQRGQAVLGFAPGLVVWLMCVWFMGDFAWGMIGSALGIYLPSIHYLMMGSGQIVWPRFTARWLFLTFTLMTVFIALLVGMDRWRVNANRENELEAYRLNRQSLESRREGMSPEGYERRSRELDQEAKQLGVE